ncbi:alpha/beta fold hydrolase [Sinosporangium siamense]|nr:alpha/beta fold hydrolase [Sinosporangium siamense]
MHVVHDGPRQAPPLLLIHGSGASGGFWGPVVPPLAGRHHVIRVDLPGCGQSPPAPPYDVPVQAGRVAAVPPRPVTARDGARVADGRGRAWAWPGGPAR